MTTNSVWPEEIRLDADKTNLRVKFDTGQDHSHTAEFLRVNSPSAEVQGHGGQAMPAVQGKKDVRISKIEPVGNYAVRITFDDGHDSGIFSWDYLYKLGVQKDRLWSDYLAKLKKVGGER